MNFQLLCPLLRFISRALVLFHVLVQFIVELSEPGNFLSERSAILLDLDFDYFDCFCEALDFGFRLVEPTSKRHNALFQLVGKILGFGLVASALVEGSCKRVVEKLVFSAYLAFEQLYATAKLFIFVFQLTDV